jgi:hypothetical protein
MMVLSLPNCASEEFTPEVCRSVFTASEVPAVAATALSHAQARPTREMQNVVATALMLTNMTPVIVES